MHRLLLRQLKRHLGVDREEGVPSALAPLVDAVGMAYDEADGDRRLLERSLDLTSQELNLRNLELARTNADLRQFAYVVSHDLQEPLRSVTGYTQLLARRYSGKLDRDAEELIEGAVGGARRMQRFIQDLLEYSKIGFDKVVLEPTPMAETRDRALLNLKAAIEASGAVFESGDLPVVLGASNQLVQLLQNLFGNAMKFRGELPLRIRFDAERAGDLWRFAVADNGIGIPENARTRVFQVFQRLHAADAYPGTGIGLAICSRIVERHGGTIWLESGVGLGTTFYFTLSAAPETMCTQ